MNKNNSASPISNTTKFNSSANPLLFPTKPKEVNIEKEQSITLEQAIEIALKNNKELQAARLVLQRSEDGLRASLAAQLPTLDGNLEFNQRADDVPSAQETFISRNRTLLIGQLEVGYELYNGGRRNATIERSRREVYLSKLDVERISEETRFNASNTYYELQNRDAQVAIAQAAIEDFSQTLRDAQLLEQAGLGTKFDVLQAEVDLANANQALTRAIAEQRNSRRRLAEVLSVGQNVELTAADEIKENGTWEYSLEESIVMAYKNRAELEQLLVRREISNQDRQIALSDTRPQVSLFANYNFTNTFADNLSTLTGYADGYNTGARISWRLYDGGIAKARADQETRNIEIEETNFANQRNKIRLQVENSYNTLIANQENIKTTETAVITATESLRLARLRFQAGVGTQTDVINAQRSLTEARGNFLQAIIGYNQSLNELQRGVSNLPDNNLFEIR
ncbi:TolC family protein [Geminocystis sp. NIES-3708]|uniref:TolC family protein n=1 Tax=Geminocystis sp. NIES-3708 TaxID=1615909 RepID=UPI0028F4181D|nr:TolC family protein [Geminocystis sp. NIES-3708]